MSAGFLMYDGWEEDSMKLGIIIETNDPEKAWNALRFANTALKAGH